MTGLDPNRVMKWLETLPGDVQSQSFMEQWDSFAPVGTPVITVFGSYDTGKSSLIRRLLVDGGVPVPEWLTISARHETFEVNGVEWAGCLIRDTPGLAVGAADIRGSANTDAALAAVELTDVAIVVVTSQLATGEREVLRALLDGTWAPQNLWFVIARFDEAGIDPEDDLDGYRTLSKRKVDELRQSLGLTAEFPIHVVAQDFAQFAGASKSVDAEIWDDFRAWDGMDDLERAIEEVGTGSLSQLRAMTEQRYWRRVVMGAASGLKIQLAEIEPLVSEAEAADARHEQWLYELREIDLAARAEMPALREGLSEIIRASRGVATNQSSLMFDGLETALKVWFDKHQQHLDRFLQSAGRTSERQSRRPSWQRLQKVASLVEQMESVPNPSAGATKHLGVIGGAVMTALQEFQRSRPVGAVGEKTAPSSGNSRDGSGEWTYNDLLAGAAAIAKIAQVVVNEWDEYRRNREAVTRNEEVARIQSGKLAADAAEIALETWESMVDEVAHKIRVLDSSRPAITEGLRESVEQLRSAISVANKILT